MKATTIPMQADASFLEYWKQGIRQLGVGALGAFDIRINDYRLADSLEQIGLAKDQSLVQLLPLLTPDQQRLLVLMASCIRPLLGRELSLRSHLMDIDQLTLMPQEMQQTAGGLIRTSSEQCMRFKLTNGSA
ncbi:hypothetical protein [Motiliproteus sp.]|uniref:hypothetical protein n=1 Tax=Motiliproteus sp. TaxID=1898955 RepID=UPI003BA8C0EF